MAKKSGNLLIKLVVLLAVAGVVFFALDSWRKKAGVADVAAPEASAPTEASTAAPALSREEAERIGTEIGTRIGTEIGTQIGREVAAQMLAERKTQLAAARKSAPPPAAEPAPEPAPVETASAEPTAETAPAPTVAPRKTRAQGSIPGSPVAQSAAGRDPWWIKSASSDPGALTLTYAGSFKSSDGSQTGIALMFSGRFDSQTDFASAISVSGGSSVSGKWRLGANRGLIYLPGVSSGSYTVTVKGGLKDADGKTLKSDISGPVDVQ
ncbi:MAG: hypothetical protein ACRES4_03020 [Nevskiales bacterium]